MPSNIVIGQITPLSGNMGQPYVGSVIITNAFFVNVQTNLPSSDWTIVALNDGNDTYQITGTLPVTNEYFQLKINASDQPFNGINYLVLDNGDQVTLANGDPITVN